VTAAARRPEARAAFWDALGAPPVQINGRGGVSEALDEAVETATRVRVDDEIIAAGEQAARELFTGPAQRRAIIIAAFRAAGFEVEQ